MRIISGKYKGRKIEGYTIDGTRPTMDRVKESLIGTIQNKLVDSNCLDLFTGSGAVGLEFLSNGAKNCVFCDSNAKVIEVLNNNIKNLKVSEEYKTIKGDYRVILKQLREEKQKFDIIFLDPPYKLNYIMPAINLIKEYELLNDNGLLICEYEDEKINNLNYQIIKEKKYGSKNIMILKKISD